MNKSRAVMQVKNLKPAGCSPGIPGPSAGQTLPRGSGGNRPGIV